MRYSMKLFNVSLSLVAISFMVGSSNLKADVCSEGVGIPPFIDAGATPNLLMLIDNSGSMLDMAYLDKTTYQDTLSTGYQNTCLDKSYLYDDGGTLNTDTLVDTRVQNSGRKYEGYFERDKWYQWIEPDDRGAVDVGSVPQWEAGAAYAIEDLVIYQGMLYKAAQANSTTAVWEQDKSYSTGDVVEHEGNFYEALISPTSIGVFVPGEWDKINAWEAGNPYVAGDLVVNNGNLYQANTATNSATFPLSDWDDLGELSIVFDYSSWSHLDGHFVPVVVPDGQKGEDVACIGPDHDPAKTYYYKAPETTNTIINETTGLPTTVITPEHTDLKIEFDLVEDPTQVICFAATGNFLNWAMSSKFDIQKKILTGGKYYEGDPATGDDDLLISEHRGCSDKGFTKEIPLNVEPAGSTTDKTLVLRVRGPQDAFNDSLDPIGATTLYDFTTRVDILGVSTTGGVDLSSCNLYLEELAKDNPSLPNLRDYMQGCLYGNQPDEVQETWNIYHSSIHDCWKVAQGMPPVHSGNIAAQCQKVYQGFEQGREDWEQRDPWEITPWNPEYICYGKWDTANPPSATNNWRAGDSKFVGYIGRCWEDWPVSSDSTAEPCVQKICSCGDAGWGYQNGGDCYGEFGSVGNACIDGLQFECEPDANLQTSGNGGPRCQGNSDWQRIFVLESDNDALCPGGGDTSVAGATANSCYDGSTYNQGCWGTVVTVTHPEVWTPTQESECRTQAEWDYCSELYLANTIDPSDLALTAGDDSDSATWGVVAALVDSAVFNQLGVNAPMMTMKGYVEYVNPLSAQAIADDESLGRPIGPRGVLYDYADEIRFGVMKLRELGSKAECDQWESICGVSGTDIDSQYCIARRNLGDYCAEVDPDYDGAKVVAPVGDSRTIDLISQLEDWSHFNTVVNAINDAQATAWTPLAEALYIALGYYGQNEQFKLATDDFTTQTEEENAAKVNGELPSDFEASWADPVQYWCQDNNVLVITEGSSTADINQEVANFVTNNTDPQITFDGGADAACQDGLEGSTYLDDISWFGRNAVVTGDDAGDSNLYEELIRKYPDDPNDTAHEKKPVTTHIITSGSLRGELNGDECEPLELMTQAAYNGASPEMLELTNDDPLLQGEEPGKLEANLEATLASILNRASSGSAASVIASSKSGVGAIYQAVFWPQIRHGDIDNGVPSDGGTLDWVGDVHAFFIDDYGRMWDDYSAGATAANGIGTLWSEDIDGDGTRALEGGTGDLLGDRRVWFYYTDEGSRVCFREPERDPASQCMIDANASATDDLYPEDCPPTICPASNYVADPDEPATGPLIQDFKYYLWSAEERLETLTNLTDNRDISGGTWIWDGSSSRRYIFTWNDLNNDGIVNDGNPAASTKKAKLSGDVSEIIPLDLDSATDWSVYSPPTGDIHHDIIEDFRVADATELANFIKWLRGDDLIDSGTGDYMFRCRGYPNCYNPADGTTPDLANQVWMLGDVIHSTPKLVAQPAEAFTIYADPSYALFIKKYRYRRNMVYFGSNDGMLHAVNAGFPLVKKASETEPKTFQYWTHLIGTSSDDRCYYNVVNGSITTSYSPNTETTCTTGTTNGPALGDEMWAYLPYNLIPHVRCRANEDCDENHKYGVDKEPRIFDMQIFPDDDVHPGGWGTILVGAMRYGGSPINVADNLDDPSTTAIDEGWSAAADGSADNRQFISSYFVLDITDPERPPVLLGEMTRTTDLLTAPDAIKNPKGTDQYADLGFSTPMPTGVVMRDNPRIVAPVDDPTTTGIDESLGQGFPTADTTWYLVFGNGPKTIKGENDQQGFLFVLPMTWLTEADNERAFRVVNKIPEDGVLNGGGIIELPKKRALNSDGTQVADNPSTSAVDESVVDGPSFVSDMIAVDLDLTTESSVAGGLYKTDAIYFGTVDGTTFNTDSEGDTVWDPSPAGGGRMMRLVTRNAYATVNPQTTSDPSPQPVYDYQDTTGPWQWYLTEMIDAGAPIQGAPSVGWDESNFWIYFGTGRFYAKEDKTDDRDNYFFGLKEPLDQMCGLTWNTITWDPDSWYSPTPTNSQGSGTRGLYRSDYILVPRYEPELEVDSAGFGEAAVYCDPDALDTECNLGALLIRDKLGDLTTGSGPEAAYSFASLRSYIEGTPRVRTPLRNILTTGDAPDDVYIKETCEFDGDVNPDEDPDLATDPGMGYPGIDGWFRVLRDPRERVVGQSALLGGLITYSSYQPFDDICSAEGVSNLYGVHYQTGTAWYEDVFGTTPRVGTLGTGGVGSDPFTTVNDKYVLGRGLSTTPSLHTSTESTADAKALIQSSTGSILEIDQENLPLQPPTAGRVFWKDDENPQVLPDEPPPAP